MDPIAAQTQLHGEDATLLTDPTPVDYNPTGSADYAPDAPGSTPLRGYTETKIELTAGYAGAFTFPATAAIEGLQEDHSKLVWRGRTWTVQKVRERYFHGRMNGITLLLGT